MTMVSISLDKGMTRITWTLQRKTDKARAKALARVQRGAGRNGAWEVWTTKESLSTRGNAANTGSDRAVLILGRE